MEQQEEHAWNITVTVLRSLKQSERGTNLDDAANEVGELLVELDLLLSLKFPSSSLFRCSSVYVPPRICIHASEHTSNIQEIRITSFESMLVL